MGFFQGFWLLGEWKGVNMDEMLLGIKAKGVLNVSFSL